MIDVPLGGKRASSTAITSTSSCATAKLHTGTSSTETWDGFTRFVHRKATPWRHSVAGARTAEAPFGCAGRSALY